MKKYFKNGLVLMIIVGLLSTSVFATKGEIDNTQQDITLEEAFDLNDLIGDIKGIEEQELKRLEELNGIITKLETELENAWEEFDTIIDKYYEDDLEEDYDLDEEIELPTFEEIIEDIEGINEEDLTKLKKLYKNIIVLEENENYEEADKLWEEFDTIMSSYIEECLFDDCYDEDFEDEGEVLTSYSVKDGKITIDDKIELEDEDNISLQNNTEIHNAIWKEVLKIVPKEYLNNISKFEIFTDGEDGILAMVEPLSEDNKNWSFSVDIKDSLNENGKLDTKELAYTLIHEFGHILTLNNSQIENIEQNNNNRDRFSTMEGIAKEKSYLNQFYNKFWKDIYKELEEIEKIEDEEKYEIAKEEFFEKYNVRFVSDYASTNPGEDIAETFAEFITSDKPDGDTIAEQKILFFYNFKELVEFRENIRKTL